MAPQYYTKEEAEALLPWLRRRLQTVATLQAKRGEEEQEIHGMMARGQSNGSSPVARETSAHRTNIAELTREMDQLLRDVTDKGIIVRDVVRGLSDFLSKRQGEDVYLCWLMDEDHIGYWHPLDTGIDGRQPL